MVPVVRPTAPGGVVTRLGSAGVAPLGRGGEGQRGEPVAECIMRGHGTCPSAPVKLTGSVGVCLDGPK